MAARLSPISGTVIIDTNQDTFVDVDILALEVSSVTNWVWDIQGISGGALDNPPNFVITPDNDAFKLNVAYANYDGLFLLNSLKYLNPERQIIEIADFQELPAPELSPDIIEMIAPNINLLVWEITITATVYTIEVLPATPVMTELTATYTIEIEANYSLNRNELVAAVDERR